MEEGVKRRKDEKKRKEVGGSFVVPALHRGEALPEGKCSTKATSPEKDGEV